MSKETLNLTIEKHLKERARKLAEQRGVSVSRLFEKLIEIEEDEKAYTPPAGSGIAQFVNLVSESDKVNDVDYKKMKENMLDERYGKNQ